MLIQKDCIYKQTHTHTHKTGDTPPKQAVRSALTSGLEGER